MHCGLVVEMVDTKQRRYMPKLDCRFESCQGLIGLLCNGSTTAFGAVGTGSNPVSPDKLAK